MAYYNRPSNAPQSAEKLTAELQKCEELQETMKGVNAYWRKTGTCMGAPGITEAQAKPSGRSSKQTDSIGRHRRTHGSGSLPTMPSTQRDGWTL